MLIHKTKDQEIAARIMATPGTMATISHAIALHFFGEEIYSWEPETLSMELADTLDVQIDEENLDKLHAIISAIVSNGFKKDWVAFTSICSTLNGENDVEDLAEMTVAEFAWGVIEVSLNDDDDNELFSPDVASLVGVVLDQEGFSLAPDFLSFANLPEKYMGSTSSAERNKEDHESSYQMELLNEYLRDQSLLLFKQIKMLPWISDEDLESIVESMQKEIGPVDNKKRTDPLY
jgi:hypothetical protein